MRYNKKLYFILIFIFLQNLNFFTITRIIDQKKIDLNEEKFNLIQ
jgi:hypothetical protein